MDTMISLETLLERKQKIQESIDNVLEAGQEFQTRNGRVKQANLSVLQQQLAQVETDIAMLSNSGYTDTEILRYRGCR